KGPPGQDDQDVVTPNPDVTFTNQPDPRFFPELATVKVPAVGPNVQTLNQQPAYSKLDQLRRAGVTTLLADRLTDYARRTGQTRFTFDGQTVVDITGYRPGAGVGAQGIRPLPQ